ncbi:16733_t:CDS:2 [Funneliformis mosseae]|uniref:16733_t:CDS:1 n=1 Tax=Funneliformis mosseae TaxID=27381 RepID=A0A9N9GND6_FUNMO|nr:16733_t:CDS:2 [Funneliformis mosseae]
MSIDWEVDHYPKTNQGPGLAGNSLKVDGKNLKKYPWISSSCYQRRDLMTK